jgi:hypothetical protein
MLGSGGRDRTGDLRIMIPTYSFDFIDENRLCRIHVAFP